MDGPTATHVDIAVATKGNLDWSSPDPQKCAPTEKNHYRDLRKVFRLERDPILCFLSLTREFN